MLSPDEVLRQDVRDALRRWLDSQLTSSETGPDQSGGEALAAYVNTELANAEERRAATHARANAVITTSAAMSALLFGAAALVTGVDDFAPPRMTLWTLPVILVTFVAAAACGLMGMRTVRVSRPAPEQLQAWLNDDERWFGRKLTVQRELTEAKVTALIDLREGVSDRIKWVKLAYVIQLASLAPLTVAVVAIMVHAANPDLAGWWDMLRPIEV